MSTPNIEPNAPAFPNRSYRDPAEDFVWPSPGLTVRAHFAAMAMQGMLADHERSGSEEDYARYSVMYADALIAALNKEPAKCQHDWQPSSTTADPAGMICTKCGERAPF